MHSLGQLWGWDDDLVLLIGTAGSGYRPDIELSLAINRTIELESELT